MRIFQDLQTKTEIISDSYPMELLSDGAFCEVKSRKIVKGEVDVDVGCGNAFGGKNEEDEEGGQAAGGPPVEKVIDLVDAFGYEETTMDKKEWQQGFSAFVKKILQIKIKNGASQADIKKFKTGAQVYLKYINGKWADLTVYTPKDYDRDNSIVFSYWKNEEDESPVFIFYLDGCKAQKV